MTAQASGSHGGRPKSAEKLQVDDVFARVCKLCGDLPTHAKQRRVVADWLKAGHSPATIYATIEAVLKKRAGAAPMSLNYFSSVMGQKPVPASNSGSTGRAGVANTEMVPVSGQVFEAYRARIERAQGRAAADMLTPGMAPAWFEATARR